MALYMIGDIQGCDRALGALLQRIGFSPSRDTLYALGDLVNRGPDSLAVLRRLRELGSSAQCLLGNHDLHLLAVGLSGAKQKRQDTVQQVLDATDGLELLHWLRTQPLAIQAHGWLMVHAGVLPQWTSQLAFELAQEASAVIGSEDPTVFLSFFSQMYGNTPDHWLDPQVQQPVSKLRLVVNALTRLRLCDAHGRMDFSHKGNASLAPAGLMPWFDVPGRASVDARIAFGHWSTLPRTEATHVGMGEVLALDAGCVWGGCLQAAEFSPDSDAIHIHSVRCDQAQTPGC